MADDITYTDTSPAGVPNATKQVTDEHATRGHMPVVKLAYSADGDATLVTADANGLEVQVSNASIPVTDNGGSLTVDGTVTANLAAGTNNIGDVDVLTVPAPLSTTGGGAEATALRVTLANDSTGVVSVDDNGGSLTVDGTVSVTGVATAANQTTVIGHLDGVEGLLTTIDADTGTVAGAVSGTEMQVDVVAALPAGTNNIGTVTPYAQPGSLVSGATAAITTTTSTQVLAAAGLSTRNYVTSLLVTNSHATVGTLVTITDGSGGSTLYAGYAAEAGGGFSISLPTPLRGTANTAIHAVCGTTGANVYVSASGFTSTV